MSRVLFGIRWKLGEWFGWDDDKLPIPGANETRSSAGFPQICAVRPPASTPARFRSTRSIEPIAQSAAEISNKTVHAMMHLGWVDKGHGDNQGQMAVRVKPRGRSARST